MRRSEVGEVVVPYSGNELLCGVKAGDRAEEGFEAVDEGERRIRVPYEERVFSSFHFSLLPLLKFMENSFF